MEQLFEGLLLQPAASRRYKTFVHHVMDAKASFKVAHELIPFYIEFKGIDRFFRNKIEDSYEAASGHLANALAVITEVCDGDHGDVQKHSTQMHLAMLQDAIRELKGNTDILLASFYDCLGKPQQLKEIGMLKARFNEVASLSLDLVTEVR